jgi:type I restriction enzyme S subunit
MTLETFFEKFDKFADAPGAVGKMRELVLHLAFSGKLLPAGEPWPLKPLKSLAVKIGSGATPAGGKESYFTEGIPLIRSMNVHFAGFEPKGLVFLSDEQAKQLANVTVQPSDVLLNITGASIGRVTTAPPEMAGGRVNQHVSIIRPIKELDAQFLAKFLASPAIQRMINDIQVGATREALTKGMIEQFDIPLPPLTEQRRIVAKVDELMALCDRLEAQQQEREAQARQLARASLARFTDAPTPANLNHLFHSSFPISPSDLRKSILTLAVQGKLLPQDAEPSFLSLESILAEASVNGVSKGPTFDKSATEILRISAGTSRSDFYVNEDDFKHVDLPPDEVEKFQLAPGDLLACRFNGNLHYVGRFSYYRGESGRVQVNPDKLIRFRIKTESHCPRYVCLAMNAAPTREAIEAMCATTAGNIGLSAGRLKTVEIPIPPLAEQRRIVAKVSELIALVDELETQLAASRAAAEKLLSALVAELTGTTSRMPVDS